MRQHVVILGGGFGGLYTAKSLKQPELQVTLIDKRNFHLFQPLLYQVATGGLSPANIASPLRSILRKHQNTRVLMGKVTEIDAQARRIVLADGDSLHYDTLVVATGSRHHYFGNDQWESSAPGLKTIEDATEMRRKILVAFEAAEREASQHNRPEELRKLLTFVVVGGGPTGVELAGALAEIARSTLRNNFRAINPASAQILLLEGSDRVLPPYVPSLSAKAEESLTRLGVTVKTQAVVKDVREDGVLVHLAGEEQFIPTATVLWGAGVKASVLGAKLAAATGVELDRSGRVMVEKDLTVPNHPEIFVIGDLACYTHTEDGKPLPGVAPVAIQQGKYVARLIHARMQQHAESVPAFKYHDRGTMATIGRASAVADLNGWRFSGIFAWLAWLFIHLMYIVGYQNRLLVLMQWAWNYVTRNRAARLITNGQKPEPEAHNKTPESPAATN